MAIAISHHVRCATTPNKSVHSCAFGVRQKCHGEKEVEKKRKAEQNNFSGGGHSCPRGRKNNHKMERLGSWTHFSRIGDHNRTRDRIAPETRRRNKLSAISTYLDHRSDSNNVDTLQYCCVHIWRIGSERSNRIFLQRTREGETRSAGGGV